MFAWFWRLISGTSKTSTESKGLGGPEMDNQVSGKPSSETGERYLPKKAIQSLSPQEYAATTRAKRAGKAQGKQFVPQPAKVKAKVKPFRKVRYDYYRDYRF
jgi:hypothetical protein